MERRGGQGREASPGGSDLVDKGEEGKPKRRKKRKKKEVGKKKSGRKQGRKGKRKRENFSVFRRSKLGSSRIKFGPRNESYTWVPKSVGFVELQEVGVLSYFDYSLSKDYSMVMRHSPNHGAGFTIV